MSVVVDPLAGHPQLSLGQNVSKLVDPLKLNRLQRQAYWRVADE